MDGFSRYVAVAPLQSKSAAEVGQGLLDHWVKIHGVPRTVYSDRGTEFTARLTQNLFQELGVQVKLGTPGESPGQPPGEVPPHPVQPGEEFKAEG